MKMPLLVVGAGPAGLFAATAAAASGVPVTVLERLGRPGVKLSATGGGRCNLTNALDSEQLARKFGRQWRFMLPALTLLPPSALRQWFEDRGVPLEFPDGFHCFPRSGRAKDVLDALLEECRLRHVTVCPNCTVRALCLKPEGVAGVETDSGFLAAGAVIVATGGMGYPQLGGGSLGYALARQAGHEIVTPVPAMVGLRTREEWPGFCTGIALPDVAVRVALPGEKQQTGRGELLFTHHGVSAPAVLDLSGRIGELLTERTEVPLEFNLYPERSAADWQEEFQLWQRRDGRKTVRRLLSGYFPARIAAVLWEDAATTAAEFPAAGRERLAARLTRLRLHVVATEGWRKAMVTRGGVALARVNPQTLESRLMPGLFFAGEVLDLDGPCGGYNLQWAFSSGMLAGTHAAPAMT